MKAEKLSKTLLYITMLIILIFNKIEDYLHRPRKVINLQNLMAERDQKTNHFLNKFKASH
jgi:hypothetical protein